MYDHAVMKITEPVCTILCRERLPSKSGCLTVLLPNLTELPDIALHSEFFSTRREKGESAVIRARKDQIRHRNGPILSVGLDGRAVDDDFEVVRAICGERSDSLG